MTKPEALRHFILGMKQPLHLETTSSWSESVTVHISEPKTKYPSGKRERISSAPLPPRAIPLLDPSLLFCPKSSLPCILLDAQIELIRREARQTSIVLV